jgi:glycosyltransferase involved in cell wall biosynthesis
MARAPLVSIVTPSYNQADFIAATIESVLQQDYPHVELIVIDGGSTDGSVDVIRRYQKHLKYWVSEPDRGQADAINKGYRIASGDLIGWLNSDDELTPGSIARLVRYFGARPEVGLVYGDLERIDASGQHIAFDHYEDFDLVQFVRTAAYISQPGSLVRRSVLDAIGPLDTELRFMMDLDQWLRAALVCRFGYERSVVARFRVHDEAKSSGRLDVAAEDLLAVYRKLFSRAELPEPLRRIEREAWAHAHLAAARAYYGANCQSQAYRELAQACRLKPSVVIEERFRSLAPRLLISSIVGGRRSRLWNKARAIYRSRTHA